MEKRIIQHAKLEEIDTDVKKTWGQVDTYMFYYYGRQIAKVSFNDSSLNISIHRTFAPWAYVSNDKSEFFANVNRVEDQIHGTNIIELSNLHALYMEMITNKKTPIDGWRIRGVGLVLLGPNTRDIAYSIDQNVKLLKYMTLRTGVM